MSAKAIKLSQEEMSVILMIRRYPNQDIIIQIQDGIIVSVNQVIRFRRKRGGGLTLGKFVAHPAVQTVAPISMDEAAVINKLRDKPFQQISISINNGINAINQTIKFRKKNSKYTSN